MNRYQQARAEQLMRECTTRQPDSPGARRARKHLIDMLIYPGSYSDTEVRDMLAMAETHLRTKMEAHNDKV